MSSFARACSAPDINALTSRRCGQDIPQETLSAHTCVGITDVRGAHRRRERETLKPAGAALLMSSQAYKERWVGQARREAKQDPPWRPDFVSRSPWILPASPIRAHDHAAFAKCRRDGGDSAKLR
jgi:hypothetical protein